MSTAGGEFWSMSGDLVCVGALLPYGDHYAV